MNRVRYGEYASADLARILIADTDGNWPFEAATRLVVEHGEWLERESFHRFLRTGVLEGEVWVGIDWPALAKELKENTIEGDAPDVFVLRLAASCAGYASVVLRDVTNQSPRSMTAIMRAVATAGGYGEGIDEVCALLSAS